ncbi:DNA-dependent ATPase protein rad54 [Globomyces sp. JEL0801]|nr:DNA-dependent ATPase protein rad54 [Globomyces sp. JEL0801]
MAITDDESDEEYVNHSDEENQPSKKIRIYPKSATGVNQKSTALNLLTPAKKQLGIRRTLQGYTPKSVPFKCPVLKKIDPQAVNKLVAIPFKQIPLASGGMKAGTTLGLARKTQSIIHALHDPSTEGALILYEPKNPLTETQKLAWVGKNPGKTPTFEVEVVVDPALGNTLRPHQIEGVKFLYDCTTGRLKEGAFGCIMADEMGLGKTLQCITLLWTLLRQSEIPGKPTIDKAIIACPSSLVKNWANELTKWLGAGRIKPYSCDNKGTKEQTTKDIEQFVSTKGRAIVNPVLIVSYETLRIYIDTLTKTEIGLLLCDEGHRLKNADSQTYKALNSLNAKRRVILSGTPIQNDLTEYFSLLSFVIPEVLGTNAEFRKQFEIPILRGRDSDATEKDRLLSEERLAELLTVANKFIIRRTAELLTKYCSYLSLTMTDFQKNIYLHYANKEMARLEKTEESGKSGNTGQSTLKAMMTIKKIVNHPALLTEKDIHSQLIPPGFTFTDCLPEFSGKFLMLEQMLVQIKHETTDKIVLISNYTQTLDYMVKLCAARRWGYCRLDGSMTINKRQKIVDRFNDPTQPEFIFLLSSKAGGCGINLIGANRLILFDPDWNPANDAQAMARVWRGQAHKQSLSSCVVDEGQDVERHFSLDALRQLFQYNEHTLCDTHDTFKCKRCKNGIQIIKATEGVVNTGATAADTSTWNHYSVNELNKIVDTVLQKQALATKSVTFVFQNKSHDGQIMKK